MKVSGNWDRIESNEIEVEVDPLPQQKYHLVVKLLSWSFFGKVLLSPFGPDWLVPSSSSHWVLVPSVKPEGQDWAIWLQKEN